MLLVGGHGDVDLVELLAEVAVDPGEFLMTALGEADQTFAAVGGVVDTLGVTGLLDAVDQLSRRGAGDGELRGQMAGTIAMIQIRMPASAGRAYCDRKIAEGKTPRYATRALERPSPATSGDSCSPTKPEPHQHRRTNSPLPLGK